MRKSIYLDYAATTPLDIDAYNAAKPFYKQTFYNPSSSHTLGQRAATAIEYARRQCADAIGANQNEIYFTAGGTESINWAMCCALGDKKHIVVSAIEHDAALSCAKYLSDNGYAVDYVKPNADGIITADAVKSVITYDTALVCVMSVNNIVGSIQPIREISKVAHSHGAVMFTDAVQAVNAIDIDVADWGVDMLAVSGHKFYAPKGVGFLYVKNGTHIKPLLFGGEQERGLRGGTVDVPSVVAMGVAIEKAKNNRAIYSEQIKTLAYEFDRLSDYGKPVRCSNKIDDIVSVVYADNDYAINGGRIAVALSCAGVCCSVGAACSAGSSTPPKTLAEMGVNRPDCSVRFSFGRDMTTETVRRAACVVNRVIERILRGGG